MKATKKHRKNKRPPDSNTFCSIRKKFTQFVNSHDQIQIYECLQKRIKASSKIRINWQETFKSFKNWVTDEILGSLAVIFRPKIAFKNYKISGRQTCTNELVHNLKICEFLKHASHKKYLINQAQIPWDSFHDNFCPFNIQNRYLFSGQKLNRLQWWVKYCKWRFQNKCRRTEPLLSCSHAIDKIPITFNKF